GRARSAAVIGLGVLAIQLVPYGRSHTNITVGASTRPVAATAAAQWCPTVFAPGSESTMSLGTFSQRLTAIQANLDSALANVAAANPAAVLAQYTPLTVDYRGVAREFAELYPVRCPRLLGNRIAADAAILAPRVDIGGAGPPLSALRAG